MVGDALLAVLERGDCERLGGAGATERVELAARLEPLHDLTRGLLLLHERLQVPQRAAAAVEGLQDVIGVQRGGVGHEAVEFVREALLDAVVVAQPAEPSHHGVAERSLRVVRGLVGDVYPALPRPREVEAREVVRHPVRESLPGFEFHAANLPKHLADNLGHHLREARDRLAQVLDHDVVEHGLVRGPGQREHLAEQGLGDEELAPLGVVRGEGQGAHLVRRGDGRLAPETGLERPEGVGDVLLGDETLEGTPVPGVPQTLGLLLGQDPASLQGKNRVNGEKVSSYS